MVIDNAHDVPILIDNRDKWKRSLYYNFSERINFEDSIDENWNLYLVNKLVNDSDFYSKISILTKNLFRDDLSVNQVLIKYTSFYNTGSSSNFRLLKFDLFSVIKTIYYFILASNKRTS